jgi:endonuclease/exonuclease/phosphatase (EEP) superfamily protein YafD
VTTDQARPRRGRLAALALAVAWAGLAGAAVPLAGYALRDAHWAFDLAGVFLFHGLLALGAAALLFTIARSWRGLGVSALCGAGIAASLDVFGTAVTPPPCAGPPSLRIAFANLLYRNRDPEAVRAWVSQADADIVILVELNAATFAALTPLAEASAESGYCLEIGRCETLAFSRIPGIRIVIRPGGAPAVIVDAPQNAPVPWRILGVHLSNPVYGPPGRQYAQAEALAQLAAGEGPLIIAGDFNATPWGRVFDILERQGGLSRPLPGPRTWPAQLPDLLRIPIDNAVTKGVACARRTGGLAIGSDHLPQIIEVGFAPES